MQGALPQAGSIAAVQSNQDSFLLAGTDALRPARTGGNGQTFDLPWAPILPDGSTRRKRRPNAAVQPCTYNQPGFFPLSDSCVWTRDDLCTKAYPASDKTAKIRRELLDKARANEILVTSHGVSAKVGGCWCCRLAIDGRGARKVVATPDNDKVPPRHLLIGCIREAEARADKKKKKDR